MFTGIVEELGVVKIMDKNLAGARLVILAKTILNDLEQGASVSVNGACLTVVEESKETQQFALDVSPETLGVTTLGALAPGSPVNLERAMKLSDRIGGHLVSGHVDAIGTIAGRQQEGNAIVLTIQAPPEILRYCVAKGSITVDGISMTINQVQNSAFTLAVIPHTAKATTLGIKQSGDHVNLESDLIGKYVERLLRERAQLAPKSAPSIAETYLKKRGLI